MFRTAGIAVTHSTRATVGPVCDLVMPSPSLRLYGTFVKSSVCLPLTLFFWYPDLSHPSSPARECARWCNGIGMAWAMSWFAKSSVVNNNKRDRLALSSDDEDHNSSSVSPLAAVVACDAGTGLQGITAVATCTRRRVQVLSIHLMLSVCAGTCGSRPN